jgi:hypothetical protein
MQKAFKEQVIHDFGGHIPASRKETATKGFSNADPDQPKKARRPSQIRFGLMSQRGVDARWFLFKKGDKLRRPLHYFDTFENAKKWRDTIGQERAEQLWHEVRLRDFISDESCRGLTNKPREGIDYRGGANVTPEQFLAEIQPFGVQFGHWQDNRDVCLNETYDALRDLAGFLNWPLERLCFNKTLGLAFGARGHGGAAAHYELKFRAINLTRNAGPGCLAHEWAHGFDHQLCGNDNMTSDPLLKALLKAIPPEIIQRCHNADATRSHIYFAKPCEIFARCFEGWVKTGVKNDYLVNIRPVEQFKASERYPYPLPDELPIVAAAFKALFSLI